MITEQFYSQIHIFFAHTEVPFIQEVSGVYNSPFLDTDELKMALRAQKVSAGGFRETGSRVSKIYISSQLGNQLKMLQIPL